MDTPVITSDPAVMLGKPVVAGTRITVELILRKFGAGESVDQLLESHPRLTREAVPAALQYCPRRPAPGLGEGSILYMASDFDEPRDEFKDYVE